MEGGGSFGNVVVTRDASEDGEEDRGCAHIIRFVEMHSFFGMPQPITFFQVGQRTWRGKHRSGDIVYLIMCEKDFQEEGRCVFALEDEVIALPDHDRHGEDQQWVMW